MLTRAQRDEFGESGFVRLPRAFDARAAAAMVSRLWSYLEEHRGISRESPSSWNIDAPWFGLKTLKEEAVFQRVGTEAVCAALDDLLGPEGWVRPRTWGGILVTLPDCTPEEWNLPESGWHVDEHFTFPPGRLFGVSVFSFLSEVPRRSGGTLMVGGSHQLVRRFVASREGEQLQTRFSRLREEFCRSHPWLAGLTTGKPAGGRRVERFFEKTQVVDDVPLQVVEITGSPGDVVLMHPWVLHVRAPNAGRDPRFMRVKLIDSSSGRPTCATRRP